LISTISYSQITHENGYTKIPDQVWNAFLDSAITYNLKYKSADSIVKLQDTIISDYEDVIVMQNERLQGKDTIIKNKDKEISICNEQIKIFTGTGEKLFSFEGFFVGYQGTYLFQDSIITKSTFLQGIQNSIYGEFHFKIKDFRIQPAINIPLARQPFGLSLKIGYRIF
jgi:hypothetical protein